DGGGVGSGLVRTGLVRTGLVRTGLVRTGPVRTGPVRTGLVGRAVRAVRAQRAGVPYGLLARAPLAAGQPLQLLLVRSPPGTRIGHLPPDVVDEVLAAHRRTAVRTGLRTAGRTYGTGRGSYGSRAYRDVRPQRAPYGLLRTGQLLPYGNQLRTDVLRTGLRT